MSTLKDKAAIVGIGETRVGKLPGSTTIGLQAEAAKKAMEDAGVTQDQVDAIFIAAAYSQPMSVSALRLVEYLGFSHKAIPHLAFALDAGGASPIAMVALAAAAIAGGLCRTALCVYGENAATFKAGGQWLRVSRGTEEFELPYGAYAPVHDFALAARRHMYEYGTTSEQLAEVAVTCRYHASLNPNAQMRQPITVEDVLNSRMISAPLHLLDCCLVSDGAGAVVITSAERARDRRQRPVHILGMGGGYTHKQISQAAVPSQHLGARQAGEQALGMAGLTPGDIDVAEIYDCFTIVVIAQLEALGFCDLGEGGAFVQGGRLRLGGELPMNTHGGLLSQGHIDGMLHITEAVSQLRGQAGERQVRNARVALVTGNGGMMASLMALVLAKG